jgi:predicted metalloprotease
MRWEGRRESSNVEDRRGEGGVYFGGRGGFSLLSLPIGNSAKLILAVIIVVVALFSGADPVRWLLGDFSMPAPQQTQKSAEAPANDAAKRFVSVVLADTEDVWSQMFAAQGRNYRMPRLVLFRGAVRSACGVAGAAMGPFYCPGDERIYVDLSFYDSLKNRLGAPGDFAQAYVLAHEVGHHVQHLQGHLDAAESMGNTRGSSGVQVRIELQADCYAGLWAHHTERLQRSLEPGDIEEAMNAASAVGDDKMQKRAQGYVVPDSFTHGSAAQRQSWFKRGYLSGQISACDALRAERL